MKTLLAQLVVLSLFLAACGGSKNPELIAPLQTFNGEEVKAKNDGLVAKPKVDIVFYVDDSMSMKKHQENMSKNIDLFAQEFMKNPLIDYRIGIMPVYDSINYGTKVKDFTPIGHLLPLRNSKGQLLQDQPPYITRDTPDKMDVLKTTLKIGVRNGLENEELFNPLLATHDPRNNDYNKGFLREGKDVFFLAIFLTDAEDGSIGVTASELNLKLRDLHGVDNYRIHSTHTPRKTCGNTVARDEESLTFLPSGPIKIFTAVKESGGEMIDLCNKSFGEQLARLGQNIAVKVATLRLNLTGRPDRKVKVKDFPEDQLCNPNLPSSTQRPFVVCYAGKVIPAGPNTWTYNEEENSVEISPKLQLEFIPNSEVRAFYTKVEFSNVRDNRVSITGRAPRVQLPQPK